MTVQRLTAAYRSRPRPSSTLGAKASTVNSYYLDGEQFTNCELKSNTLRTRVARVLIFGLVQFSRSTEAHLRGLRRRSLKTEQRTHQLEAGEKPGRRSREISLERR
jgi:hypothetical protein